MLGCVISILLSKYSSLILSLLTIFYCCIYAFISLVLSFKSLYYSLRSIFAPSLFTLLILSYNCFADIFYFLCCSDFIFFNLFISFKFAAFESNYVFYSFASFYILFLNFYLAISPCRLTFSLKERSKSYRSRYFLYFSLST